MWPVIEVTVEPTSCKDSEKLLAALERLIADDAGFEVGTDHESGQTRLRGSSEEHLDAKLDHLIRGCGIGLSVGAPQVAYRETITRTAEADFTYKRQNTYPAFARVRLLFEPGAPNSGFAFESAIVRGAMPDPYPPAVRAGLDAAREHGLIAGFPVIDFKATLLDGAYHDLDSSPLAFEAAARGAFSQLREKGGPVLLEPVMAVEIVTPEEYLGSVIGDLNGRRGQIQAQHARQDGIVVAAFVPLANMFAYAPNLGGMCRGRARFTMHYSHYAPVPPREDPDGRFPPAVGMRV